MTKLFRVFSILVCSLIMNMAVSRTAEATITATGQQCNARTSGSQASVSCTVSVTSGNTVVLIAVTDASVRVGDRTTFDNSGCSDNQSNTYNFGTIGIGPSGISGVKMCWSNLTHTASTTFTWTNQGGNGFSGIAVIEFAGVLVGNAFDLQAPMKSSNTANGSISYDSATTTNDEVVLGAIEVSSGGTFTCPTGYTQIAEDETYTSVAYSSCYKILSSTSTETLTWTSPASFWAVGSFVLSGGTNGLTGSNIYVTGHQCRQSGISSREASIRCTIQATANNYVVMMAASEEGLVGAASNAGCSDSASNTWTYGVRDGTNLNSKICFAKIASSGQTTIIWTNQGGSTWSGLIAIEVAGVAASGALDVTASNHNNNANATTGTTGTTGFNTEIAVAHVSVNVAGTLTCGAGYTQIAEEEAFTAVAFSGCYKILSSTGTQSMTWTSSAGTWSAGIITLSDAGASSSGSGSGLLPWVAE